jgi:hypothetical protein
MDGKMTASNLDQGQPDTPPEAETAGRLSLPHSAAALGGAHWWSANATRLAFPRRRKTFAARIGFIGSDALLAALEPECEVVLLTPGNWKLAVETKLVDAVLIEPCMRSLNSVWGYHFADGDALTGPALVLLETCRAREIPVLGWITSDALYEDLHGGFARHFDKTFCCDASFAAKLVEAGISAEHLPAAVQPAIYNPFVELADNEDETPPILFDGWTSVLGSVDLARDLEALAQLGLGIIESRAIVRHSKRDTQPALAPSVLGCVSTADRLFLLKRAQILVQRPGAVSRQIEERIALEAAACRTVVLVHGELPKEDARRGFAHTFSEWNDLVSYARRLLEDRLLWLREAQIVWRHVQRKHPMPAAVSTLLATAGLPSSTCEVPRAAILTPTIRPELLPKVIAQYRAQTWPNKELIVIANTSDRDAWDQSLLDSDENEQIVFLPTDYWAGAALNVGALRSSAEFAFRLDDDDFYGEHYIEDCMLHAIAVDPDIMGKPGVFLFSQEKDQFFHYPGRDRLPILVDAADLYQPKVLLTGFTISVRLEWMRERGYPEEVYGFADTGFLKREKDHGELRVASLDPLNAVYERRADVSSHTWQHRMDWDAEALAPLSCRIDDLMV